MSLYYRLPKKVREKIESLKLDFIEYLHLRNPEAWCWADCVSWAMSSRWKWWKIEKPCKNEKPCYCGQWYDGKCLAKMTDNEIAELRKANDL